MNDFPFSGVVLCLKYIDFSKLEPIQQASLEFGFGRFFAEEPPNDPAVEPSARSARRAALKQYGIESLGEEPPFRYRRFAGDASLPRGRYFSISDDIEGHDHGTLAHELISYTDHVKCGSFELLDPTQPNASTGFGPLASSKAGRMAVTLRFHADDGMASPVIEHLRQRRLIAKTSTLTVDVPYEVREEAIRQAIDLRDLRTQKWLYERLTIGIPGVAYEYEEGRISNSLSWSSGPRDFDPRLWTDSSSGTCVEYAPCVSWDRRHYGGPENFVGLLPFLIFPTQGGSPITDAIGRWLRKNGVEGLIYPSARNDVECIVENGALICATGWNFVDYRDSPLPRIESCLVIEPDSWRFRGDAVLQGGGGGLKAARPEIDSFNSEVKLAGSWRVLNQARITAEWFLGVQSMIRVGNRTRQALYASINRADDPTFAMSTDTEAARIYAAKPLDFPAEVTHENRADLIDRVVALTQEVEDTPIQGHDLELLLKLKEFLLEHPTDLAIDDVARTRVGDTKIQNLWRKLFDLGRPARVRHRHFQVSVLLSPFRVRV